MLQNLQSQKDKVKKKLDQTPHVHPCPMLPIWATGYKSDAQVIPGLSAQLNISPTSIYSTISQPSTEQCLSGEHTVIFKEDVDIVSAWGLRIRLINKLSYHITIEIKQ